MKICIRFIWIIMLSLGYSVFVNEESKLIARDLGAFEKQKSFFYQANSSNSTLLSSLEKHKNPSQSASIIERNESKSYFWQSSEGVYSLLNKMLDNTNGKSEIVHVTNLNADGPGSFKEAVTGGTSDKTRIVVFDVSGECELPIKKGDVYDRITVKRENLWIAGQTAPDPGDGTGRGFTLKGGLSFRRGYLVVEHIRVQPIDGHPNPEEAKYSDARGITVFTNPADSRIGKNEFFCFRNITIRWTQDVAMGVGGWANWSVGDFSYPENIVIDNCLFAEPLNQHMDLEEGGYVGGWNRGFNFVSGAQKGLFRGNLHASAVVRTPQVSQGTSSLIVNNYTYNYGAYNPGSSFLWPIHVNAKHVDNYAYENFTGQHAILVGVASNYAEAGNKTKLPGPPYTYTGARNIDNIGPVGSIGPNKWWDDGNNKVISYYDPSTAPLNDYPNEFNPNLAQTPYYETYAGAPNTPFLEVVSEPPFPLPSVVFTADQTKEHCLNYAGAWPGSRDKVDQRIIDEVRDKVHSPVATSEIGYTPVTTVKNTPPSIPDEPSDGQLDSSSALLQEEENGLTQLENWLVSQHIAAGGCLKTAYIAPEWIASNQETVLSLDNAEDGKIVVNPNPTDGSVNIQLHFAKNYPLELSVVDINGKLVMHKLYTPRKQITFNLKENVSGTYFVKVKFNGQEIVKKVLLDHQ